MISLGTRRWVIAGTVATALMGAVMTACSSSDKVIYREPLGDRSAVKGGFEVRERAIYSIAIEAVLVNADLATRQRAFTFLRSHDYSAPTRASVSLRRVDSASPGEWIRLLAVNPIPSSWSASVITTELHRLNLDPGHYELEVSFASKTYADESFTSNLIVERAYIGK